MIVTVTLNPAFDHLLVFDELATGRTVRARNTLRMPGGKGVNIACCLAVLGEEAVATGLLAGASSQEFEKLLRVTGVGSHFIYTNQQLRTDFYVLEEKRGRQTLIIEEADPVELRFLNNLREVFDRLLEEADLVVIGGSLPAGVTAVFIRELMTAAARKRAKVALNVKENILKECLGQGELFLVKPDLEEGELFLGEDVRNPKGREKIIKELAAQQVASVILPWGYLEYLAASGQEVWQAKAESEGLSFFNGVQEAMFAGYLSRMMNRGSVAEALKFGLASALSTSHNRMNYPNSRSEVEQLADRVSLRKVN